MFKKIMLFIVLISALGGTLNSADALEYSRSYCINSTLAYYEDALYDADTGDLSHYNETEICDYGCFKGECMPVVGGFEFGTIIGLCLIAFFFLVAALKLDKETHGVIQVLFLFIGIMFVILTLAIISELSDYSGINAVEAAADSAYQLSIYVFWLVLFYFIVLFIYKILVMTGTIKPIKWSL